MSVETHRARAPRAVTCRVITVSDTRTVETDTSGAAIVSLLAEHGHRVSGRTLVRDDPPAIARAIEQALAAADTQVVMLTGGTGIGPRDGTIEVVERFLDKRLDGFGELFRMLSYEDVGAAAMLSRACAGLARGRIIVALPGSERAVRLAMTRLLLPELGHMVWQGRAG